MRHRPANTSKMSLVRRPCADRFGAIHWQRGAVEPAPRERLLVQRWPPGSGSLRLSRTAAAGMWRRDRPLRATLFQAASLGTDAFAVGSLSMFGATGALWLLGEAVSRSGGNRTFGDAARADPSVAAFGAICAAMFVLAWLSTRATRTIDVSPRRVLVDLRCGPLLWQRTVPLAAVERAELHETWGGRPRARPTEPLRRHSARLVVRGGGSITLLARVEGIGRNEAAWLVHRVQELGAGAS